MRLTIGAMAALMLTACGGQAENKQDGSASASGGGSTSGAAVSLQPGQWEMTTTVVSMNIPNMPQGVSPPTPPPSTISMCLTPEQAAAPNGGFLTGTGEGGGCRSDNMTMADGRIQGVVQCDSQGTQMRATVNGQFTPTSYEINQQVQTTAQGMSMEIEARTNGRRTGDCAS